MSIRTRDPRTCDPPPKYALCKSCLRVLPSHLECVVVEYRCKRCDHRETKRERARGRALVVAAAKRKADRSTDAEVMAAQLVRFTAAHQDARSR